MSAVSSGCPIMIFRFCIACPAAPFTKLSNTARQHHVISLVHIYLYWAQWQYYWTNTWFLECPHPTNNHSASKRMPLQHETRALWVPIWCMHSVTANYASGHGMHQWWGSKQGQTDDCSACQSIVITASKRNGQTTFSIRVTRSTKGNAHTFDSLLLSGALQLCMTQKGIISYILIGILSIWCFLPYLKWWLLCQEACQGRHWYTHNWTPSHAEYGVSDQQAIHAQRFHLHIAPTEPQTRKQLWLRIQNVVCLLQGAASFVFVIRLLVIHHVMELIQVHACLVVRLNAKIPGMLCDGSHGEYKQTLCYGQHHCC